MGGGSRGWVRGRCLGRGSTAAVYLASPISGDGQSFFAAKSAELSRSAPLQREQHILSSLCSPHIVSCLGSDVTAEADGRVLFNLFMEYVPGGNLAEVVTQHGCLDEHIIRAYTRGILKGLAYLHSRGVVHCDVKGHNILVAKHGGSVKLADLGCARWVDDGRDDRAVISGTPLYMAPEVARGKEQGTAADIWALGCTVIEMATGCLPWRDVEDPVAAIHRIAFSNDVPEFPCNISDDARDFLGRCLSRDPTNRWSAEELLTHPFVTCSEEVPVTCVPEAKRSSPKSTLDQIFWDSWQEEDEAGKPLEMQQIDSAQERLRQLVGGGVSPIQEGGNATWEERSWITIRNSENSRSPSEEEDEPSTSAGSWWVEPVALAGGGRDVVSTDGYLPSKSYILPVLTVVDASHSAAVVDVVRGGGNDPVGTHKFPDRANQQGISSDAQEHYICYDLLLLPVIKDCSFTFTQSLFLVAYLALPSFCMSSSLGSCLFNLVSSCG